MLCNKALNTSEMAEAGGYSQVVGIAPHRNVLQKHGYLIRKNFSHWALNPQALQLPLLTAILSYQLEIYEEDGVIRARKRK